MLKLIKILIIFIMYII